MIELARFKHIKEKYGHYASWAIWADVGEKPKDNVGDLSILDPNENGNLLEQLNPDVILVGLNISRKLEMPLGNFHDPKPQAMDFKIRYALRGSPFWGAYMTDIIKDFKQKVSGKVMRYLRKDSLFEENNITIFREEINDLEVNDPTIIAFGRDAEAILNRNLRNEYRIIGIPHYSKYISKEQYREEVADVLSL